MKIKVFTAALFIIFLMSINASAKHNPAFLQDKDIPIISSKDLGYNIKRTMQLLESSTPYHRKTVKVLFYGQSIITPNNTWTHYLISWLRNRYPYSNIVVSNLAIGGYRSDKLSKMVENDLKGIYPDLIILYNKGDEKTFEQMIKAIRKNTTAEVLMLNHHYIKPERKESDYVSRKILPKIAKKYQIELCNIRDSWKLFVNQHCKGNPNLLLQDQRHLNQKGHQLMFNLVKQHFVYRPSIGTDRVRDIYVGSDVHWKNGKLVLAFKGNRIEAIAGNGRSRKAQVLIDGKQPSKILDCYYTSRIFAKSKSGFNKERGHLLRVKMLKIPKDKEWSLRIKEIKSFNGREKFIYKLEGKSVGIDGVGSSARKLKSKSRTWEISPQDFCINSSTRKGTLFRWRVYFNGTDLYTKPIIRDPSLEVVTVLASGLSQGKHKLILKATDKKRIPAIKAFRVYCP